MVQMCGDSQAMRFDDDDNGDVPLQWSGNPNTTFEVNLRNNLHACDNPLHIRYEIIDIDNGDMDNMDIEKMSILTSLTSDVAMLTSSLLRKAREH
jgi:hypothetical protein